MQSLHGIHARADVNDMADLTTKLSNIPPTFLRYFLSPKEEDILFLNDLEEEFVSFSVICTFSRRKLAKNCGLLRTHGSPLSISYQCDGFRRHFQITSTTFELLTNVLAPSEHIHLVGRPLNKENT